MKFQLKISSSQARRIIDCSSQKKRSYFFVRRDYRYEKNVSTKIKKIEIPQKSKSRQTPIKRWLIGKIIFFEKIKSFLLVFLFCKEVIEWEQTKMSMDKNIKLGVKTYPYIGSFLEIECPRKNLRKVLKIFKIKTDPWLAKPLQYYEKIISYHHHRKIGLFFADRHIWKNRFIRTIYNFIHYRILLNDMFMVVNFEIEWRCNRKCKYCPNFHHTRPVKKRLSFKIFEKVLLELAKLNFNGFIHYHFYNEPLLDERLEKFVKTTKKICPQAKNHIYTNGDFLTLERYKKLVEAGVDFVFVTVHDGFLSKERKKFFINAKRIKNIIDFGLPQEMYFNNRGGLVDVGPKKTPELPCYWPSYDMEITSDGKVLPCCNDYLEKMRMGDVKTSSIKSIWLNNQFKNFRGDLKKGLRKKYALCRNCNVGYERLEVKL
jgi:2-deoxy-scyllo-inosamine dehydrogenase (SAM-dependent)